MTTRERLLIQAQHVTETHHGQQEWWQDLQTVWASVVPLGTEGRAQYQQIAGTAHYSVRLKGQWALTMGGHRFKWGSNGGAHLVPVEPPHDPTGEGRVTVVAVRVDADAVDIPDPNEGNGNGD